MTLSSVGHQCGTCSFGTDPTTSVLDLNCRTHDVDNLYVVDGSFFPSSSAINPTLTIIANALRVGDILKEELCYVLDSKNAFWAILNLQEELEGYCSFGPDGRVLGGGYSDKSLDIGMGIRPDLIGQGRGKYYAQAVAEYGAYQYGMQQLRVTIAGFNKRAQRVWDRLGFEQVQKFVKTNSADEFVVMVRHRSR